MPETSAFTAFPARLGVDDPAARDCMSIARCAIRNTAERAQQCGFLLAPCRHPGRARSIKAGAIAGNLHATAILLQLTAESGHRWIMGWPMPCVPDPDPFCPAEFIWR